MGTKARFTMVILIAINIGTTGCGGLEEGIYEAQSRNSRWIGDSCYKDEQCDYPGGYCHGKGQFCTRDCETECPDVKPGFPAWTTKSKTFCVYEITKVQWLTRSETGGICVAVASEQNHFCADLPESTVDTGSYTFQFVGTEKMTVSRFLGFSVATGKPEFDDSIQKEVCYPHTTDNRGFGGGE